MADDCPCNVDIIWVPVTGSSGTGFFGGLGRLFVVNPEGRDLFHAALRIQFPVATTVRPT